MRRSGRILTGALWIGMAGCSAASRTGAPELVPPSDAPAERGEPARRPAPEAEEPGPPGPRADALPDSGLDTISWTALPPAEPPDSTLPILPVGVVWAPAFPAEGSVLGIRLLPPRGAAAPREVTGTLDARPVRFGPLGNAWFGMAAVPIGETGPDTLHLAFRYGDGTVRERAIEIPVRSRTFPATRLSVAPRFTAPSAAALARIERERERIRSTLASESPEWLLRGSFRPPRPMDVTSPYGQERLFNGELQSRHTGVDLRGAQGAPVYAAARGRVALAGDFYFSGQGVYLDHGHGVYTGYFHLSRIRVREGQLVEAGDRVGDVGATGRVTGPHLHWSVWVGGESLDAASLLELVVPSPGSIAGG